MLVHRNSGGVPTGQEGLGIAARPSEPRKSRLHAPNERVVTVSIAGEYSPVNRNSQLYNYCQNYLILNSFQREEYSLIPGGPFPRAMKGPGPARFLVSM